MAVLQKFNDFSEQQIRGVHDWGNHIFKVALTNTAPVATHTQLSDIIEIAGVNGYNTGGTATPITLSELGGVTTVNGGQVVFTATGGAIGTFRYYVLYNDSSTSPLNALVAWADHGTVVNLADGEQFTIQFNALPVGKIFDAV
jgi:hypothetical protein